MINVFFMIYFYIDIQFRELVEFGDYLNIQVVDVGLDNVFGIGDDFFGEILIFGFSLIEGEWYSFDVLFLDLGGLIGWFNLVQVIFVFDVIIFSIYVDNVYFYNDGGLGGFIGLIMVVLVLIVGVVDVIFIFSDVYMNINFNLNLDWGQGIQVFQVSIEGNNILFYIGLNFQGLELESSIDVSEMEFLYIDYWMENFFVLNVFLISIGFIEMVSVLFVFIFGWASVDILLGDFLFVDLVDII